MAEDKHAAPRWPPPTKAPFMPYAKIHINAPASIVYELATSPGTWPDWNIFVPSAHMLSRRNAEGENEDYIYTTTDNGIGHAKYKSTPVLQLGDVIRLNVEMPPAGSGGKRSKTTADVFVTEMTVPSDGSEKGALYRAVWDCVQTVGRPNASRQNEIEVLGEAECEYRTWEEMTGLLAYAVKYAVGPAVFKGLGEWAEGLKTEAERRYKAQQQS